jgi:hypothetical protein
MKLSGVKWKSRELKRKSSGNLCEISKWKLRNKRGIQRGIQREFKKSKWNQVDQQIKVEFQSGNQKLQIN